MGLLRCILGDGTQFWDVHDSSKRLKDAFACSHMKKSHAHNGDVTCCAKRFELLIPPKLINGFTSLIGFGEIKHSKC